MSGDAMDASDLDARRRDLLAASLDHVAFDGWSWTALERAAEDLGLDATDAANAFPGGPAALLELHSTEADYAMLAALDEADLDRLRVRERVALAIRTRLEQNEAHREAIRRGLSFLAMPAHAALSARLLARTVDAVWTAAGDASVDINFYTKRGLLAGVYMATLLYWLEDTSEDHARTWAFLDRRIDEVIRVGGRLGQGLGRLASAPERLAGLWSKGRGLNRRRGLGGRVGGA